MNTPPTTAITTTITIAALKKSSRGVHFLPCSPQEADAILRNHKSATLADAALAIALAIAVAFFIIILDSCSRSFPIGLETTAPTTQTTHSLLPPPTTTHASIIGEKSTPAHSYPTNTNPILYSVPTTVNSLTNISKTSLNLFAVLITTNLVSVPCTCGFCNPDKGIRVPEHINQIGYDLALQVTTNYLPIIQMPY